MIFDASDTDAEKVYKTRQHYLNTLGKMSAQRAAMQSAYAFRHGQQWPDDVKAQLAAEGRPALMFNMIAPTVRELVGANEDQRREPKLSPVGGEDVPTSDVLNHLWKRVYMAGGVEMVEYAAFEDMVTCGLGFTFMDAQPCPDYPDQLDITYDNVSPFDIVWDPNAGGLNLSDASFFYWPRWMGETDFKVHYPDQAEVFDEVVEQAGETPDSLSAMSSVIMKQYTGTFYVDGLSDSSFFDRKNKRVRVLHLEYKVPMRKYFVWDPRPEDSAVEPQSTQQGVQPGQPGQAPQQSQPVLPPEPRGWTKVSRKAYKLAKESGVRVHTSVGEGWKWFECTGAQVLFDDDQPLPIDGSQIRPVTCYYDTVRALFYGMVRDLMDPQLEFNKRTSQELHLIVQSAQPGLIYDQGAFPGKTNSEVERRVKQPGFALEKMKGAEYMFRESPPVPAAPDRLAERAQALVQIISGIDLNPLLGGQPDQVAVGTAMLSHRKGLLAITPILKNFREFQQQLLSATVQVIMRGFSDEQIEEMLGNSQKLIVRNGVVYDKETQAGVQIKSLREIKWNIEMESAAANTTQQMMMFSLLQALRTSGVAVDPDVFFSYFPGSEDEQQKLIAYYKQAEQSQAQAAQAQAAQAQDQVKSVVTVEALKVQQRQQEAELDAATTSKGQQLDLLSEILKLFVSSAATKGKADVDRVRAAIEFAKTQLSGFQTGVDVGFRQRDLGQQMNGAAPGPVPPSPQPVQVQGLQSAPMGG